MASLEIASFEMDTLKGKAKVLIQQPSPISSSHKINVEGLDESIVIEEVCYAEYKCLLVKVDFYEDNHKAYYTSIPIYHNDNKTNLNECLLAIKSGSDSFNSYCEKHNITPSFSADIVKRKYRASTRE